MLPFLGFLLIFTIAGVDTGAITKDEPIKFEKFVDADKHEHNISKAIKKLTDK